MSGSGELAQPTTGEPTPEQPTQTTPEQPTPEQENEMSIILNEKKIKVNMNTEMKQAIEASDTEMLDYKLYDYEKKLAHIDYLTYANKNNTDSPEAKRGVNSYNSFNKSSNFLKKTVVTLKSRPSSVKQGLGVSNRRYTYTMQINGKEINVYILGKKWKDQSWIPSGERGNFTVENKAWSKIAGPTGENLKNDERFSTWNEIELDSTKELELYWATNRGIYLRIPHAIEKNKGSAAYHKGGRKKRRKSRKKKKSRKSKKRKVRKSRKTKRRKRKRKSKKR